MFDAIAEGRVQDLGEILENYQGDINAKRLPVEYDGSDIMTSPLEFAAFNRNPEIMSMILDMKRPIISIDVFEISLKMSCEECFEVLLDHSNDLLTWTFNQNLFERIIEFSASNEFFFSFVSKLSKKISFNDKLGLIEQAFNRCTDHDKILIAIDAVVLDVSYGDAENISSRCLGNDEQAAIVLLVRAMIFKKDFDGMLPKYYHYTETERSKELIKNYKAHVEFYDNRVEEYPQPEDIVKRDGFEVYLRIADSIKNNTAVNGMKVLLRILNINNKSVWDILEESPSLNEAMEQMNLALEFVIQRRLFHYAELLIAAGFKFPARIFFNSIEFSWFDILEFLLAHGADPNNTKYNGNTALIRAVAICPVYIVERLLIHNADPNILTDFGESPILKASEKNSIEKVQLLLRYGANPNLADSNTRTLTPLIKSIFNESEPIFELLLSHGAYPNTADKFSGTPLIYASLRGLSKMVRRLLDHKADPNIANRDGNTPLIKAVWGDSAESVELLLKHQADPNIANHEGDTPLIEASRKDSANIMKLLLTHNANPNAANNQGVTPLKLTLRFGRKHILPMLYAHGAIND